MANSKTEPLRLADTSSPRDTLNGFLADTKLFIEDFRQHRSSERSYRAVLRASQALDYSATPESDSWYVRNRRIALLQELLARIELPPASAIPGNREIADGSVTRWTIPNTGITIARIVQGPRAGQFLFSAETVQALDRLYRQAKHLPYQPGATTGIYEELASAGGRAQAQEQELRNRLKPIDTYSPRSTLEGFLDNVNRAYALVSEANAALQATSAAMTREQAARTEKAALSLLQRAGDTLDLSQIPEALRRGVGIEATLQLKEILDRMLLPPLDSIPNTQMVTAARKEASGANSQSRPRFHWKVPNSQIEIVEITEGEQQGQFLFSASTVRHIQDLYGKVKDLPYRKATFGGIELEYLSPELSQGFYESYATSSGRLVPGAHVMGSLIAALPAWFKTTYAGQMVWQWTGLLICIFLTAVVAYSANRRIRLLAMRCRAPSHDWLKVLNAAIILILVRAAGLYIEMGLNFTSSVQVLVTTVIASVVFGLAAWVTFLFCIALAETVVAMPRMRYKTSESALLRIGTRVAGSLMAIWIVIVGIRSLGADLIPLLAGLGIGGLAVALAAQSTIANFIGGLILLANKPVQVADFCRYGDDPSSDWLRIGTVEEINWLSTRIRGIDRTITTIPNAAFASMHIVNLSKRDQRLVRTKLQMRYETTADQMRYVLVKLREMLLAHPMVTPEPARVRFVGYGAYSKDIEIFCYLRCSEQDEFLAIQEDLLLRIEDIVQEAGSGFAFPAQTVYFARDAGLDGERQGEAEAKVGQLRSTGKLPFPEFDEAKRRQLADTLDYPPIGSPDYRVDQRSAEMKSKKVKTS